MSIDSSWLTDDDTRIILSPYLEMLVDSNGSLGFEDVRASQERFVAIDTGRLSSYNPETKAFWLHLLICGGSRYSKWYLGLKHPTIRHYRSIDGGDWDTGLHGYATGRNAVEWLKI